MDVCTCPCTRGVQAQTHTLTLTEMLPASAEICRRLHVSSSGWMQLSCFSPRQICPLWQHWERLRSFPVLHFPPFLPKVQKSHTQPAGILEAAWGLIFGSACDRAAFPSCPVLMSVSLGCEIVPACTHMHTHTDAHTPHPDTCFLTAGLVTYAVFSPSPSPFYGCSYRGG